MEKEAAPRLVSALRVLWCLLHLTLPVFAAYLGVSAENTGLPEQHVVGMKGVFPFFFLLLLLMQVVFYRELPRSVSGMLILLTGPPLLIALGAWLGPETNTIQYATECGIIYALTVGFGFTSVVFLGSVVSGKEGPGLAKTLAQLLFIAPFAFTAYEFCTYLWSHTGASQSGLGAVNFTLLLLALASDSVVFFREAMTRSIFAER